jgi:internalin A
MTRPDTEAALRRIEQVRASGSTKLDLSHLQLRTMPPEVAQLTGLTALNLSGNMLTDLPAWFGDLAELSMLFLAGNEMVAVPECLRGMTALTELHLADSEVSELPRWLANLPKLAELSIGARKLTDLPEWLREMPALRVLGLNDNKLSRLPDWIGDLGGLTDLQIRNNELVGLPNSITKLTGLTGLSLRQNKLTELPGQLSDLRNLRTLMVDGNELTEIPEWIGELRALTIFIAADNRLTGLPDSMSGLARLTSLVLQFNRLTEVPEWVTNLSQLRVLDVSHNDLTWLPEDIGRLRKLQILLTNDNYLAVLPDSIGRLERLDTLSLSRNRFKSLPDSIGRLARLTVLHATDNRLTILPASVANLTGLFELDLSDNRLVDLPRGISRLANLTALNLSGNSLTRVHDEIARLTRLRSLALNKNLIRSLPDWLVDLPHLVKLTVTDNPLTSPPPEITAEGGASVLAFLRARRDGSTKQWTSKLLVVGEGGVGKTSLVKALAGENFDPNEPTTHGMRIHQLNVPHPKQSDVRMQLSAWDFGGQEIYHATHQFFLTKRSLFLLLWNSRLGWEQGKLRYWLDIITARAPESPIILVATHVAGRPVDLPLEDLRREYPMIAGSVPVDNETGEGIDALHARLAREAAALPLMGIEWPAKWLAAADRLRNSPNKHVTPDQMWLMMAAVGIDDRVIQRYIAVALHELGDILYYSDDPELCETVVLRPEWVNEYISKVLDSDEVADAHGLLTRKHLAELWRDLDRGMREHFLGMMDKYDLSYRIDGVGSGDVSLVVERLPWDSPPYQAEWEAAASPQEIRVLYRLNTMPPGIPTWFIARSHRFSTNTHWRTGAVLKHGKQLALVRADTHRKTVELTVRGPAPAAFFSILDDGLNRTLERFPGLDIERQVPCICEKGCTELYNYEDLSNRLSRVPPRHDIECRKSGELVDVPRLLLGLTPSERDTVRMSIEQIARSITRLEEQAEYNQRMFLRIQNLIQVQQESRCPSVFALVSTKGKRLASSAYEIRLYCEEPGAWHRLPEPHGVYPIRQPAEWFRKAGPYIQGLLKVLKHAAPLAGPILGITVEKLDQQLKADCDLMKELASQAPGELDTEDKLRGFDAEPSARAATDADFRALEAMLTELDSDRIWGGLSRTTTPEGLTLYLCKEHRARY